jgi:uncharacterized membrane protein YhhN
MEIKLIFLIILAFVSVIYLITLFFKDSLLQFILKGCLLPLILAVYIFGTEKILVPIILALAFGWIGDLFLLKINNLLSFRFGLASFLAGHICYITAFFNFTQPFNYHILIISAAVTMILGVCIFKLVQPGKDIMYHVIAYEIIIMLMAISALQIFFASGGVFGILVMAGSICFVVSDGTLAYDTFRNKTKIGSFIVMLTYIAAQLLITLGFCAV